MTNHDDATRYRALLARDSRFDGLFFVGVTSTGIYCRPVCPARTPRADRCRFFSHAAQAEQAGFRPCLRCRPELAPGWNPYEDGRRTARLAAERIAFLGEEGLESLASDLKVSDRQLRRLIRQEFGVSPVQLAQTSRLLLAKKLLTESSLSVTEVAFASGFGSLRRFNTLFRSHYGLTPSAMRGRRETREGEPLRLSLAYRPPLDWPALLGFLRTRAILHVERVEGESYSRTVELQGKRGWVRVSPQGQGTLVAELSPSLVPVLPEMLARLRRLFDLDARPDVVAAHLGADPGLAPLVRERPGLRVPGAFQGFELAVRAILGQRISVAAATTLAGRLVGLLGTPVETPWPELTRAFPGAPRLAQALPEELRALGITQARSQALVALAQAVAGGRVSLEPGPDTPAQLQALVQLPGIGEWTAQVIAMRALRWPDAFPRGDLGLLKWAGGSLKELDQRSQGWRPWRAYAALHLWNA